MFLVCLFCCLFLSDKASANNSRVVTRYDDAIDCNIHRFVSRITRYRCQCWMIFLWTANISRCPDLYCLLGLTDCFFYNDINSSIAPWKPRNCCEAIYNVLTAIRLGYFTDDNSLLMFLVTNILLQRQETSLNTSKLICFRHCVRPRLICDNLILICRL